MYNIFCFPIVYSINMLISGIKYTCSTFLYYNNIIHEVYEEMRDDEHLFI